MSDETKWALFYDYKWRVLPVVKQTEKTVTVQDGSRERRLIFGVTVVSFNAEALRAAAESLTSSDALMQDERYKSGLRRNERNAAIIASLS